MIQDNRSRGLEGMKNERQYISKKKYDYAVLLVLLMERRPMVQANILARLEYMMGKEYRRGSALLAIKRLYDCCVIDSNFDNNNKFLSLAVLSPKFIKDKKTEIARFFGFKGWAGGIIKAKNSPRSTYDRIGKSFSKLVSSRFYHNMRKLHGYEAAKRLREQGIRPLTVYFRRDEDGSGSKLEEQQGPTATTQTVPRYG